MHRPKEPTASRSEHGSEASHVLSWQKEVARSAVGQDAQPPRPECQTVVTNILKPTIMVANASTESNPGSDANSKAFIGTLLGAAAGAAVAYAMTKGEEGGKATAGNIACQMVEAARSHLTPSVGGSQGSYPQSSVSHVSRRGLQTLEYTHSQPSASRSVASYQSSSSHKPTNRLTITAPPPPQVSTLINTFVPPSEVPRYRRPSLSRSQTDGAIPSVMHSTTPSHLSSRPKTSRTSSAARTITLADQTPSKQSSVVTEIRHPRDVPLPASKTTSITSRVEADLRRMVLDPRKDGEPCTAPESIAPSDSISQAASKRSRGSRKSNRHSSRAGSHRREEERSQFSEETIKAGTNKTGTRRASIMSLPTKPSSKASVHRSVVSFLPGM